MNISKDTISKILDERSQQCSCYMRLVKITGKRYSFICGSSPDYPLPSETEEIQLKDNFRLTGQRKTGDFTSADLLLLKETGEIIEKYLP